MLTSIIVWLAVAVTLIFLLILRVAGEHRRKHLLTAITKSPDSSNRGACPGSRLVPRFELGKESEELFIAGDSLPFTQDAENDYFNS